MEDPSAWGTESRAAFRDPGDPAKLATAVVKFHRTVDAVVDATVRGHSIKLACSKGCSYCCNLRVEAHAYEVFALAEWLRSHFTADALEAVLARLRQNVRLTRELGVEARKRTLIPCALLGPDGACSAYEARPAQCRRFHSTRIESCLAWYENPVDDTLEAALHPALAHNAAVIVTQTQHAVRAHELDVAAEDLNIALLEALTNPKAWRRWKGGKKAFVGP
jgi:Fe-S-cluster containining protein